MGKYINPDDETKEAFVNREGKEISVEEVALLEFETDSLLCCLVDNGLFTAGLICYCDNELKYIQRSLFDDDRPKRFYMIDKSKLEEWL
jgi:hypothetical protein